ncbi:Uncharacterised protein [Mannheimia haemolytica]|uniref:Uncharacterized protein n=1 Tax=Mannheimia haemolytica TaxID=75985 RepID=A0A378MZH2_MANHA|nr:Uncharacterised protein [Mannheimia haemolytica]
MAREKIIIDTEQFQRTISRISHQIIEKHGDLQDVVIVASNVEELKLPS